MKNFCIFCGASIEPSNDDSFVWECFGIGGCNATAADWDDRGVRVYDGGGGEDDFLCPSGCLFVYQGEEL